MSSSDGKQKSVELGDVGHRAFTYFLQEGLRGAADKDGNGVVTADELWSYLHRQVTEASQKVGNRQTPVLMGQMTHNLALTLNPSASRQKRRIATAIESLVGLRDDQLTTQEGRFCLEIVQRGPQSSHENVIASELVNLAEPKVEPGNVQDAAPGCYEVAKRHDHASKVDASTLPRMWSNTAGDGQFIGPTGSVPRVQSDAAGIG